MSLSVSPVKLASVAMSSLTPKASAKAGNYSFSEAIMPRKDQVKQITVTIFDKIVDNVKNKPDANRNIFDYIILVADKMRYLNPKMYLS